MKERISKRAIGISLLVASLISVASLFVWFSWKVTPEQDSFQARKERFEATLIEGRHALEKEKEELERVRKIELELEAVSIGLIRGNVSGPPYVKGKCIILVGSGSPIPQSKLPLLTMLTHYGEADKYKGKRPFIDGIVIAQDEKGRPYRGSSFGIYEGLPDDIRTVSPEDAGTIIYLTGKDVKIGNYVSQYSKRSSAGVGAYQLNCTLTIIDNTLHKVVGKKVFQGSLPSREINIFSGGASNTSGTWPIKEITDYLLKLPRRN